MKTITHSAILDKYGFPVDSPVTNPPIPQGVVPWKQGVEQSIQTRKVKSSFGDIKTIQKQLTGSYASGTFADGGTLFLTSTLTPNPPHALEPMFAIPYPAIYLGTAASGSGQLYPVLGTANGTMFPINASLDFQSFNGTAPKWRATIINHSGAGATVGFNITWQYLWFNQGTVA